MVNKPLHNDALQSCDTTAGTAACVAGTDTVTLRRCTARSVLKVPWFRSQKSCLVHDNLLGGCQTYCIHSLMEFMGNIKELVGNWNYRIISSSISNQECLSVKLMLRNDTGANFLQRKMCLVVSSQL